MFKRLLAFALLPLLASANIALAAGVGVDFGQIPSRGTIPYGKASDGTFVPQKTNDDGTPVISGTVVAASPLPVKPDNVLDGIPVTSATIASAATILDLPTAGFGQVTWQFTSIGTSNQVTFEESNDDSNFAPVPASRVGSASGAQSFNPVTPALVTMYVQHLHAAYVRVRVSSYSSGNVIAIATFKRGSPTYNQQEFQVLGDSAGTPINSGCKVSTGSNNYSNSTFNPCLQEQNGATVNRPFAIGALSWRNSVVLSDTTNTAVQNSCGASLKNYVTFLSWSSLATTVADALKINDNVTAIFTDNIPAGAAGRNFVFPSPLAGTAATAMNVQLTGSPTGNITVNATGYCAP